MARHSKPDPRQREFDFDQVPTVKKIGEMTEDEIISLGQEIDALSGEEVLQRAIETGLTTEEEEIASWNMHRHRYVLSTREEQSLKANDLPWRYGGRKHLEHIEKMAKGKWLHRIVTLLESMGVEGAAEALDSMTAELHYLIHKQMHERGEVA